MFKFSLQLGLHKGGKKSTVAAPVIPDALNPDDSDMKNPDGSDATNPGGS